MYATVTGGGSRCSGKVPQGFSCPIPGIRHHMTLSEISRIAPRAGTPVSHVQLGNARKRIREIQGHGACRFDGSSGRLQHRAFETLRQHDLCAMRLAGNRVAHRFDIGNDNAGNLAMRGSRRHMDLQRPRFFLSVRVLSRLFRRLFLERLRAAHQAGRLRFFTNLAHLAERDASTASTSLAVVAATRQVKATRRAVRQLSLAIHGICGQTCGEVSCAGPAAKHIKLL